jgi:hypothetical protein
MKEKKRSLSARLQCLISSSRLQELVHRHLYCRTLEVMVQMTGLHYKRRHLYCRTLEVMVQMTSLHYKRRHLYCRTLEVMVQMTGPHYKRRHLYCRTLEVMVQTTSLDYKRKFRLFKFLFVCRISYFLQTFCMYLLFLDQNSLCGTTYFSLTLRLWENLSPLKSSRLTSPVLE